MKKFLVKFLILFNLLFASIAANEDSFVEKISYTVDALSTNKDFVWKDFNISDTPLIITFGNGHIYAFGLKKENPAWQEKKVGTSTILFSDKDEWNLAAITMQDQFIIDGQKAFVFHIDEDNAPESFKMRPILVLVHELFHRYQFEHFQKMQDVGQYKDGLNIENLSLIHLEEHILIDFLKAPAANKLEILKNYSAVHQARVKIMDPASLKWEYFQQRMEGLADYASIETFKTFPIIHGFSEEKHLFALFSGYIQGQDPQELAVKWRHYGVGALLGFTLDYLNVPDWKTRIENGESQGAILNEVLPLSESEIAVRLQAMKALYGYEANYHQLEQKVTAFQTTLDALLSHYDAQNGIVAHIGRPSGVTINGGGTNHGIFHLQDGNTMLVNDKSYSSTTDNLWEMEFKDIPLFFQDKAGNRIMKVDRDLTLVIDGAPYSAKDLMEAKAILSFDTLYWDCATSRFKSSEKGELQFTHDGFFVNFL